jgi:hypothetical protein
MTSAAPRFHCFGDEQAVRRAPWLATGQLATLDWFERQRVTLSSPRGPTHGRGAKVHVRCDSSTGRVGVTPRGPGCRACTALVAELACAGRGAPTDPP